MKKSVFLSIALFLAATVIYAQKAGRVDTTKHETFYSCSMHPEVMTHDPGKCSKCGMELSLSTKEQMKAREMKRYNCPVHLDVTKHDPGKCPKCGKKLNLSPKEQMKAEVVKLYTCPMHPEVALDKEGVCAKCGKALVEKKTNN
jgi:transcription initiation factor IIE alpha subunit